MYQKFNATVANSYCTMEAETIQKNAESPKSYTSRGNMKRRMLLFFAVLCVSIAGGFAQNEEVVSSKNGKRVINLGVTKESAPDADIILLRNGNEIQALVQEIGEVDVKYKKFDNPNGPNYTLKKSEIFMIRYPNGDKDVFATDTKPIVPQPPASAPVTEQPSVQSQAEYTLRACGVVVASEDFPSLLTYKEALRAPAGYRLPTIEELECMAKNKITLKLATYGEYWSSEDAIHDEAYTVTMDDGERESAKQSERKRVRYIKAASISSTQQGTQSGITQPQVSQPQKEMSNQSAENYALLNLYRPGMYWGCAVFFDIDLDDQEVWRCKNGRKKTIKIYKEGPITIHAKTESDASVTLDVEFGKEYYVECTIGMGAWIGHPILTLKDESVGNSMFNKIKAKKDDTDN